MKIDIWFGDGRCARCYAPSFDRNLVIAKENEQVGAEYLTKKIGVEVKLRGNLSTLCLNGSNCVVSLLLFY